MATPGSTRAAPALRARRQNRGLTQDELAQIAQVHRGTVVRLEKGKEAKISTLHRLAKVLGVSTGELMGDPA